MREILAPIVLDCPDWVVAEIAGVNVRTVQFWVDRCLNASQKWAMESQLSGHVWTDEMRFAPARADGVAACRTYKGRIAKDAYLEVALIPSATDSASSTRKNWVRRLAVWRSPPWGSGAQRGRN